MAGLRFALGFASLLLAGAACSSKGDDSQKSAPAKPVELADFCAELAAARCVGEVGCCPTKPYADGASCVAAEQARCQSTSFPVLSSPQYQFDAQQAGEIIARIRRMGEHCSEPDGPLNMASLLKPNLAPGAACHLDVGEITSNPCKDTICKPSGSASFDGSCLVLPGAGELCPDQVCSVGLSCVTVNGEQRCNQQPVQGTQCSGWDAPCAPGLVCALTPESIAQGLLSPVHDYACQPPHKNGDKTGDASECESGLMLINTSTTIQTCIACSKNEDCLQLDNTKFQPNVSIDNYAGYCDAGVCKDGLKNVLPSSKSAGAICFNAAECRSQTCMRPSDEYGHCGAPNLTALFCPVAATTP